MRQYRLCNTGEGSSDQVLSIHMSSDRDFRATRPRYATLCSLEEAYYEAPVQRKRSISRLRFPSSQRVRNTGHGIHLDFSQRKPENVRAKGSEALQEQVHQERTRRVVFPSLDCYWNKTNPWRS